MENKTPKSSEPETQTSTQEPAKQKWYDNRIYVIGLLILFFPVGLYALWRSNRFPKAAKILLTVITVIFVINIGASDQPNSSSRPAPAPAPKKEEPKVAEDGPKNSKWDGSVRQVKDYLKDHLNDAKSVEYVEWSEVAKTGIGYAVRCKYRAKNALGAYVLKNQIFHMDKDGKVLFTTDYE